MSTHAGAPRPVTRSHPEPAEPLVGRDREAARLLHTLDSSAAEPLLLLLGDVGMGRSALLDRVVRAATTDAARVLRAAGSESESSLAFAALHQLLRPVSAEVDDLPGRQRAALYGVFGTGPIPADADPMLIGVAVLSLLSALAERGRVLVVLDDAQWFDRASLDALSFAARRPAGEPVTMLVAARTGDHLPGFDHHIPTLTLGPLDDAAAGHLLDLQPRRPTGRTRARILAQADGNPPALAELARTAGSPDAAAGPPAGGPLPLTEHLIDPVESRSVAVYARRALGAAALAEGAHEEAYHRLRAVFTADGEPVHYHAAYPALADLAAAAVRTGRRDEVAGIVERAAHTLGADASPRLRALIERARGLPADAEDAEPYFRAALADPESAHRPFERAQTLLDFAEWLRRRRRIAEARVPLAEALETFRRLGARPWIERARVEARAAGLDVTDAAPDALAELSPQQQQIVRPAARGLTNREIGERLFLSPRTVGSHLYRSFPKLAVTSRSQLRDLIDDAHATPDRRGWATHPASPQVAPTPMDLTPRPPDLRCPEPSCLPSTIDPDTPS
ncbi:AAA family ATPase [Embleya sp. NPDC055664]